jgi:hypothetical protein
MGPEVGLVVFEERKIFGEKVMFSLEQTMKTQRRSRRVALLFP